MLSLRKLFAVQVSAMFAPSEPAKVGQNTKWYLVWQRKCCSCPTLGPWPVLRDVYWKIGTLLARCVGLSQVSLWSHPPAHLFLTERRGCRCEFVHILCAGFWLFSFSVHFFHIYLLSFDHCEDRSHRWLGGQTGDHTGNLVARQVIGSQICRLSQELPQVFAVIWWTCQQKFWSKRVEVMRKIFISRATEHRVIRHKSAANDRWEVWAQRLLNDATKLHQGQ